VEDYHQQFSRAGHGHITSMTEHLYSVEGTKGLSMNYADNNYLSSSKRKLTHQIDWSMAHFMDKWEGPGDLHCGPVGAMG